MAMTMTKTFREHLQRAIFENCDLWDIWSEWWENMIWPTKIQRQWQRQIQIRIQAQWRRQWQRQWHWHLQSKRSREIVDFFWQLWTSKHNNNRDLAIKSNTVDSIRNSCDVLWGSFGQMFTFCEKLPIIVLAFALCKMRRHFIFEIEMTLVHAVTQPWGSRELSIKIH